MAKKKVKKKKTLAQLVKGDKVYCDGNSGFCDPSFERVKKTTFQFDEKSGKKYKVIWLSGERKFDSRDGSPMTPPLAYFLTMDF
jgi:hypothetical protein